MSISHLSHSCSANYTFSLPTPLLLILVATVRTHVDPVAYPGIFSGGGGLTNSVAVRENGDLGAVAS